MEPDFTIEQFKQWVEETFPDNISRQIAEVTIRDGLKTMADFVFKTNSSEYIQQSILQVDTLKNAAEGFATQSGNNKAATQTLRNEAEGYANSASVILGQTTAQKVAIDLAAGSINETVTAGYRIVDNVNIATNTPNLATIAKVGGDAYLVSVGGVTNITGTPVTAKTDDVFIWNSAQSKWIYRERPTAVLIDPRKSPNLILSANSTPENWLNAGAATATQPAIVVQTQPATITLVKGAKGLGFMQKFVMQPNSRVNYFSNRLSLDALPVGEKVHLGYFRYVTSGLVLSASTSHKLWPLPENVDNNIPMEILELGGGLQYVRSVNPITVPNYTTSIEIRIYWYAAAGSAADSELWFGSPSLVKTVTPLAPLMYVGGEDMSTVPDPKTSQNLISYANLSPEMVLLNGGGSSVGDKPVAYRQSGTIELISTVKNFRGFSYAIKAANMQLSSRMNYLSQIMRTAETAAPGSQVGLGFFLQIATGVELSQVTCNIVDATATGVAGATFTMEFVDLGNGLRYYRSIRPVSIPTFASQQACVGIYVYTSATSVTGDVYLMSPSLVKTSQKLQPQFYLGQESISADTSQLATDIAANKLTIEEYGSRSRNNYIRDAGFAAQEIGSTVLGAPWGYGGFSSLTNFQAPIIFELVPGAPAGTKAMKQQHSKRSSDGKLSFCTVHQIVTVPTEYLGMTKFSYAFWMMRDSLNINPVSFQLVFFPNLEDSTGSTTSTPALPSLPAALNTWHKIKFENLNVPAGTKRISVRSAFVSAPGAPDDVISNVWIQSYEVAFNSAIANAFSLNYKAFEPDYFGLKGKKFTQYGDSIVAANVSTSNVLNHEALAISNKFGMTVYVRGVGGTRVVDNNSTAWFAPDGLYLGRPIASGGTSDVQPPNSTEWKSSMSSLERINNTIPADTDILFIRGLTNDYLNYPLGNIDSPHDQNTVYGAYMLMLDRIYARIPNAVIILATPTHRDGEDTAVGSGAAAGLKFEQVRDVVRQVAKRYKYLLCDMSDSGINQLSHPTYLSDGIHPNAAGYIKTSAVIFKTLKTIYSS